MNNMRPNLAIIEIPIFNVNHNSDFNLNEITIDWFQIYEQVGKSGSLLLIGKNEYVDNELIPWPLMVADHIIKLTHFNMKNVFIYYKKNENIINKDLVSNHVYIIFLVRSLSEYYFNKDSIREEHIFKNIEWGGKREKGSSAYHDRQVRRYSLNGRDPGNVFYTTYRDEKGYITTYNEYENSEIYEKFILLLTEENSTIFTNIQKNILLQPSNKLKRNVVFTGIMP